MVDRGVRPKDYLKREVMKKTFLARAFSRGEGHQLKLKCPL